MLTLFQSVTVRGTVTAAVAWYTAAGDLEGVGLIMDVNLSTRYIPDFELLVADVTKSEHLMSLMYATQPLQVRITGDVSAFDSPEGIVYHMTTVEFLTIL